MFQVSSMTWLDLRPVVAKPRQVANMSIGAEGHGRPWPGQGRLAVDLFVCWVVVDTLFRTGSCVFRTGIRSALWRPWQEDGGGSRMGAYVLHRRVRVRPVPFLCLCALKLPTWPGRNCKVLRCTGCSMSRQKFAFPARFRTW